MAMSKGTQSNEPTEVKRYQGVASVFVIGVNPTKAELSKLYGREITEDPIYVSTTKIGPQDNQVEVPQIRFDFMVKTDADKCNGIDLTTKVAIYVAKAYKYNKDGSKVKVIDKYGRTAWATPEEVKNKTIPQYKNGPAHLDVDFRPLYIGEDELTEFIISYLNIPSVEKYNSDTKTFVMSDTPEESEARLDKVDNYFSGDISEIKEIIAMQPNNKVKVMFGIKTTEENKQYQAAFTHMFLRNHISDYSRLFKEIKQSQDNGAYVNVSFYEGLLKEYSVEPTPMVAPASTATPATPWG